MAHLLQKSRVATVVGISLVMMLAACSSDQRYKRQVSGDESYLQAAPLQDLHSPAGMILPLQRGDYDVPAVSSTGGIGKQLDIRPPVQALALLSGSRAQYSGDTATLLVENSSQNQNLWSRVVSQLQAENTPIATRQDASQTLTTDWVKWSRLDEDVQYEGRYQVQVQQQGYQQAVIVKMLSLQQQGTSAPVTNTSELQRYNGMMLNRIIEGLDKQDNLLTSQVDSRVGVLNVQSGADDTGLPVLIVRGGYGAVWERLPAALEKAGMKVTDSSRPQGTLSVTYRALSSSGWDTLGAKDPELKEGDYKLQVGDLNNRSSLQFIDSKGKPLTQSQNDALVAVFQAAFNPTR